MSNIRRMLMMLANDLPKRESIIGKSLVEGLEYNDGLLIMYVKSSGNPPGSVVANTVYTYTSPMQFYEGDYIEMYIGSSGGSSTSLVSKYKGAEEIPPYDVLVKNGTIGTREYTCDEDCQLSFCHQTSVLKSTDIYVTRTLSQEAYDYALSFGKKVVKDLKKTIDASDNPAMLIKRINDWKYLIHSLVDTGYTSWLKGDGSAYVDTGIIASSEAMLDMVVTNFDIDSQSSKWSEVFGYRKNDYPPLYVSLYGYNGGSITNYIWCKTRSSNKSMMSVTKNDIVRCYVDNSKLYQYKNGILSNSVSKYNGDSVVEDNTFYLFTANNNGVPRGISDVYVRYCDVILNDNHSTFVPYYNGSEYCMLDINSGVIYENANVVDGEKVGAFGFVVTDADGDEYEDFCDIEGNRIVTTLNDGEVLCWKQYIDHDSLVETTNNGITYTPSGVGITMNGTATNNSFYLLVNNKDVDGGDVYATARKSDFFVQLYSSTTNVSTLVENGVQIGSCSTDGYITFRIRISKDITKDNQYETPWIYKLNEMFAWCVSKIPTTPNMFIETFHSEGEDALGCTAYTPSPIPLIVVCGSLHYALNKSVRDYAEEKGKLNELNTYCCENKDAIAIFNADKTKVDTLLE